MQSALGTSEERGRLLGCSEEGGQGDAQASGPEQCQAERETSSAMRIVGRASRRDTLHATLQSVRGDQQVTVNGAQDERSEDTMGRGHRVRRRLLCDAERRVHLGKTGWSGAVHVRSWFVVAGGLVDVRSPKSAIQRDSPNMQTRRERSRGKTPSPVLTVLQRQEGTAGMAEQRRMLARVSNIGRQR